MLTSPDTAHQDHRAQRTGARKVASRAAGLASVAPWDWSWMLLRGCLPPTDGTDSSTQWPSGKLASFPVFLLRFIAFLAVVLPLDLLMILSQQSYFGNFYLFLALQTVSWLCLCGLSQGNTAKPHQGWTLGPLYPHNQTPGSRGAQGRDFRDRVSSEVLEKICSHKAGMEAAGFVNLSNNDLYSSLLYTCTLI